MKIQINGFIALTLASFILSCEIEDDFGKFNETTLHPAVSLASNVEWIGWKDNENLLYYSSGDMEIKIININSKTSSTYYTLKEHEVNENYVGRFSYLSQDKLLAYGSWHDDSYSQNKALIYLIDVTNDEQTKVGDFDNTTSFDLNTRTAIYNSDYLATSVYLGESATIYTWLYDLHSGEGIFVGPGSPMAFSPDGTQLLCHDYSYGTYLYNVTDKTQQPAPFTLSGDYYAEVRWTESGVIEANLIYGYPSNSIQVRNLTTNNTFNRKTSFSSQYIYLSPSSKKIIDGSVSCLSPYLKECPGQESKITLLMVDTNTNKETEIIQDKLNLNLGEQFFIESLVFSPDEKQIAFINDGSLFINPQ